MPRTSVAGRKNYKAGDVIEKTVPIPLGLTGFTLRLSRNNWPEKSGVDIKGREVIYGTVEISYDGGLTYPQGCGVGAPGGNHIMRDGSTSTETTLHQKLLEPDNPNRVARARFEVYANINTQVDLDVE